MIPKYAVVMKRVNDDLSIDLCTHRYEAEDSLRTARTDAEITFAAIYKLKRGKVILRKSSKPSA